ncbi:MAG: DUF393 domain-containing protein [Gammaproteobacteria bacterium]|nr:DUF393 domain-containing protein [Gammaproteobacteria bacterium]
MILFDGECKLCSAWVPFVIKRDPNAVFKFCSVQSPKGQELLANLGLATDHFETMVLLLDQKPYYKSEAFFKITQQLKKPWPLVNILRFFPLRLRDWIYDRIALNRYRLFGRHNYCMIPTKQILQRFVS